MLGLVVMIAATAAVGHAQVRWDIDVYWDGSEQCSSYIEVNPATGAVFGRSATTLFQYVPLLDISVSAVFMTPSPSWNEAWGWLEAEVIIGTYVTTVGTWYGATADHGGWDYFWEEPFYITSTEAWVDVPNTPTITLQSIDNSDPNWVAFNYSVNPPGLYSGEFRIDGEITYDPFPSSTMTFHLDPKPRWEGTHLIEVSGSFYGFTIPGPGCHVTRTDGGRNTAGPGVVFAGGEEFGPQIGSFTHLMDERYSEFSYCMPVSGYTLLPVRSSASISTLGHAWSDSHSIWEFAESHDFSPAGTTWPQDMSPVQGETAPAQGEHFRTKEIIWLGQWLQSGASATVTNISTVFQCNEGLAVGLTWPWLTVVLQ